MIANVRNPAPAGVTAGNGNGMSLCHQLLRQWLADMPKVPVSMIFILLVFVLAKVSNPQTAHVTDSAIVVTKTRISWKMLRYESIIQLSKMPASQITSPG